MVAVKAYDKFSMTVCSVRERGRGQIYIYVCTLN